MTFEERLQQMLGAQAFQIAALSIELEKAQKRIAELEKPPEPIEPPKPV